MTSHINGQYVKRHLCQIVTSWNIKECIQVKSHMNVKFVKRRSVTVIYNLAGHKRIHTGEKQYECELCKKMFIKNSDLTRHTRLHTGEKPFSCSVCQKSYFRRFALTQHNKTAAHIEKIKIRNIYCLACMHDFKIILLVK